MVEAFLRLIVVCEVVTHTTYVRIERTSDRYDEAIDLRDVWSETNIKEINIGRQHILTLGPVAVHAHLILFIGDVGPLAIPPRLVGLGNVRRCLDAHPPSVRSGRSCRPGCARGVVRGQGLGP